jgi:hypothetical protein
MDVGIRCGDGRWPDAIAEGAVLFMLGGNVEA